MAAGLPWRPLLIRVDPAILLASPLKDEGSQNGIPVNFPILRALILERRQRSEMLQLQLSDPPPRPQNSSARWHGAALEKLFAVAARQYGGKLLERISGALKGSRLSSAQIGSACIRSRMLKISGAHQLGEGAIALLGPALRARLAALALDRESSREADVGRQALEDQRDLLASPPRDHSAHRRDRDRNRAAMIVRDLMQHRSTISRAGIVRCADARGHRGNFAVRHQPILKASPSPPASQEGRRGHVTHMGDVACQLQASRFPDLDLPRQPVDPQAPTGHL
ncbi:hypothetical protein IVB33_39900 [Bradyrhizobium sp. 24]|nr:hypothetical protein [Bradyrhizobium sp. 24]